MATTLTQSTYAALDLAAIVGLISIRVEKSENLFSKPPKGGLFINTKAITDVDHRLLLPLVPVSKAKTPLIHDALQSAICGTFLVPDGEEKLRKSLNRLANAIDRKLSEAINGTPIDDLILIGRMELSDLVQKEMKGGPTSGIHPDLTVRTEVFEAHKSDSFPSDSQDIRLLKGVITFNTDELTETIAAAVERQIRALPGLDPDEVDDAVGDFQRQRIRTDVDTTRLHFLVKTIQEKAMGRVEREIGMHLLVRLCEAATTHKSFPELTMYGENVSGLTNFGVAEEIEDKDLELPLIGFGVSHSYRLRPEMMLASAFDALPLRVVGSGFISDEVFGQGEAQRIANSYHVNLNGPVALGGGENYESALHYRLEQIRKGLTTQTDDQVWKRRLARKAMRNLATLWLCLPDGQVVSPLERFERLRTLVSKGSNGIEQAIGLLESRIPVVNLMADRLHSLLKERKEIFGNLEHAPLVLHLGIQKSILDREGLKKGLPFKALAPEKEEVQVLEHILVSPDTPAGMLVSFRFSVQISEGWISRASDKPIQEFEFRRDVPERMVYLVAYPGIGAFKDRTIQLSQWLPKKLRGIFLSFDPSANLKIGPGLEPDTLAIPALKGIAHQIFIFVALRRILEHSRLDRSQVVALRFQESRNPDEAIYQQLKTVEFALSDRNPVSSQGLTLEPKELEYRRKAAAWGLLSDLPARFSMGERPAVERVAVVAMTGRATDQLRNGLGPVNAPDDGHGIFGEIITFEAEEDGWRIQNPRRFIHSGRRGENLLTLGAVKAEIGHLAGQGFRKILFIAREFQAPRFGLSEKDRRPYLTPEVFDTLASEIGECDVYPLIKGTYDGVRVGNLKPHQTLCLVGGPLSPGLKSAVAPFLTVANLRSVGTKRKTTHSRCTTYYVATGAYSDPARSSRLTSELLTPGPAQNTLRSVLLGLHFFRYEKVPDVSGKRFFIGSKLDPFSSLTGSPNVSNQSESVSLPVSRRNQVKISMLPILNRIGSVIDLIPVKPGGPSHA